MPGLHPVLDIRGLCTPSVKGNQQYTPLTKAEQFELGRRMSEQKDESARNRLVMCHDGFVRKLARRWTRVSAKTNAVPLEYEDLVQEGTVGLMMAAEKWDYRKGFSFSTYAVWWIRHALTEAVLANTLIRIPHSTQVRVHRALRIMRDIAESEGRSPRLSEIAEKLELTEEQVVAVLRVIHLHTVSLHEKVPAKEAKDGQKNKVYEDYIVSDRFLNPESAVQAKQELGAARARVDYLKNLIRDMCTVSEKNRMIFLKFYGLDDNTFTKLNLRAIGKGYDMTGERVRQILALIWGKAKKKNSPIAEHKTLIQEFERIEALEGIVAAT